MPTIADERKAEMNRLASKMKKTGPVSKIMAGGKSTAPAKKAVPKKKKKAGYFAGKRKNRGLGQT